MSAKEDGVFFSTSKTGYNDGYGDTIVEFKVPAEKLVLDDIFENEAHFKIPLKNRKEVLDVAEYLKNASMSIGDGIRKDEFLNRKKQPPNPFTARKEINICRYLTHRKFR